MPFFLLKGGNPLVVNGLARSNATSTVDIEQLGDKILGYWGGFLPFLAGSVVLAGFYEFEELATGLGHEGRVSHQ
jgi:hypothetical protein